MGFESALAGCGLPQPGSNRGYRPEQLITQFLLSVWCGANRFEHGEVSRLLFNRFFPGFGGRRKLTAWLLEGHR